MAQQQNTLRNRSIRLKEWGVEVDQTIEITEKYLERCDDSLSAGHVPLRTDGGGFLRTDNDIEGIADRRKLVLLGDSFVESLFVLEQERFASVLERELDIALPGAVEVLNGGYSGATSLHMHNTLVNKIRPFFDESAAVVLFTPMSDDNVMTMPWSFWSNSPRIAPIMPPRDEEPTRSEPLDSIADIRALWSSMLNFLRAYRVPTIVVASPFRRATVETDTYYARRFTDVAFLGRVIAHMDKLNETILEVVSDFDVPIIDSASLDPTAGENAPFFYDILHLNKAGHARYGVSLANAIAPYLR